MLRKLSRAGLGGPNSTGPNSVSRPATEQVAQEFSLPQILSHIPAEACPLPNAGMAHSLASQPARSHIAAEDGAVAVPIRLVNSLMVLAGSDAQVQWQEGSVCTGSESGASSCSNFKLAAPAEIPAHVLKLLGMEAPALTTSTQQPGAGAWAAELQKRLQALLTRRDEHSMSQSTVIGDTPFKEVVREAVKQWYNVLASQSSSQQASIEQLNCEGQILEDVLAIRCSLAVANQARKHILQLPLLELLGALPLTPGILAASQIATVVRPLRNDANPDVAQAARWLISQWKQVLMDHLSHYMSHVGGNKHGSIPTLQAAQALDNDRHLPRASTPLLHAQPKDPVAHGSPFATAAKRGWDHHFAAGARQARLDTAVMVHKQHPPQAGDATLASLLLCPQPTPSAPLPSATCEPTSPHKHLAWQQIGTAQQHTVLTNRKANPVTFQPVSVTLPAAQDKPMRSGSGGSRLPDGVSLQHDGHSSQDAAETACVRSSRLTPAAAATAAGQAAALRRSSGSLASPTSPLSTDGGGKQQRSHSTFLRLPSASSVGTADTLGVGGPLSSPRTPKWTPEEQQTFIGVLKEYGRDLTKLQEALPHRPREQIRNWYNNHKRKLNLEEILGQVSPPRNIVMSNKRARSGPAPPLQTGSLAASQQQNQLRLSSPKGKGRTLPSADCTASMGVLANSHSGPAPVPAAPVQPDHPIPLLAWPQDGGDRNSAAGTCSGINAPVDTTLRPANHPVISTGFADDLGSQGIQSESAADGSGYPMHLAIESCSMGLPQNGLVWERLGGGDAHAVYAKAPLDVGRGFTQELINNQAQQGERPLPRGPPAAPQDLWKELHWTAEQGTAMQSGLPSSGAFGSGARSRLPPLPIPCFANRSVDSVTDLHRGNASVIATDAVITTSPPQQQADQDAAATNTLPRQHSRQRHAGMGVFTFRHTKPSSTSVEASYSSDTSQAIAAVAAPKTVTVTAATPGNAAASVPRTSSRPRPMSIHAAEEDEDDEFPQEFYQLLCDTSLPSTGPHRTTASAAHIQPSPSPASVSTSCMDGTGGATALGHSMSNAAADHKATLQLSTNDSDDPMLLVQCLSVGSPGSGRASDMMSPYYGEWGLLDWSGTGVGRMPAHVPGVEPMLL